MAAGIIKKRKQTRGQYVMGVSFNPSKDKAVDEIKRLGAKLYALSERERDKRVAVTGTGYTVMRREIDERTNRGQVLLKDAVMNFVAAVTKPPFE